MDLRTWFVAVVAATVVTAACGDRGGGGDTDAGDSLDTSGETGATEGDTDGNPDNPTGTAPPVVWSVIYSTSGESSISWASLAVGGDGSLALDGSYSGVEADFGQGGLPEPSENYGHFLVHLDAEGGPRRSEVIEDDHITFAVDGAGNTVALLSTFLDVATLTKWSPGGQVVWSRSLGEFGLGPQAMAIDLDDNIWLAAPFGDSATFDDEILTSPEGVVHIAQLDADGTPVWVQTLPGPVEQLAVRDPGHAVLLTRPDFGATGPMIFVGLDDVGEQQWVREIVGSESAGDIGLDVDADGRVVVVGRAQATIDLGGGPLDEVFVAILAPDGSHVTSRSLGSSSDLQIDQAAWVGTAAIIGGGMRGTYDFGGGVLSTAFPHEDFGEVFAFSALLVALEPDGSHRWSALFPTGSFSNTDIDDIKAGPDGSLLVCGSFAEELYLGDVHHIADQPYGTFVAKFEP